MVFTETKLCSCFLLEYLNVECFTNPLQKVKTNSEALIQHVTETLEIRHIYFIKKNSNSNFQKFDFFDDMHLNIFIFTNQYFKSFCVVFVQKNV